MQTKTPLYSRWRRQSREISGAGDRREETARCRGLELLQAFLSESGVGLSPWIPSTSILLGHADVASMLTSEASVPPHLFERLLMKKITSDHFQPDAGLKVQF